MRIRFFLSFLLLTAIACGDDASVTDTGPGRDGGGDTNTAGDTSGDTGEEDAGPAVCDPDFVPPETCSNDGQCDDGCFCNGSEGCVGGVCSAGRDACPAGIECAVSTCNEDTDSCDTVLDNAMCSDGNACNGIEMCDVAFGGCRNGAPPYCNDEDSCTVDSCDPVTGCQFDPRDLDGDGFRDGRCGGDDCDDDPRFGAMIFPGAVEDCSNRRDDNCDGVRDYADLGCMAMNDTCETPELLDGPGTYSGATRGLRNTVTTCGFGSDAFFAFTLEETQDVQINVAGGSGTSVALRTAATCSAGPDIRCNNASPAALLQRSLAPGDYIIVVKQSSPSIFDLTLRFSEATEVPPVDQCNAGTEDISEGGTFTGMYIEVEDDYRLSCGRTGARDAAYTFTLDEPMDVLLTASTMGGSFPTTYLSLVRDCDLAATAPIQCVTSSFFGTPNSIRQRELAAGTYFVLIESSDASAPGWSLDAEFTDPGDRLPGDACSSVIDITPAAPATTGMGSASLTTAERDTPTSCGSTSTFAKDVYFTFELTETRDVTYTINGAGSHFSALSTACGDTGSELRCRNSGSPSVQTFRSLPAGTYFIAVSTTLSSGTVTASVATRAPTPIPPNDRCTGAIDISAGGTTAGTLSGFEDDVRGCSGTSRVDAFYEFTLAARSRVTIVATRTSGPSGNLTLTLRNSCTDLGSLSGGCDTGNPSVISTPLDAGTYSLIVDSASSTAHDFELLTTIAPL